MRKIKENRERCRFNVIEKRSKADAEKWWPIIKQFSKAPSRQRRINRSVPREDIALRQMQRSKFRAEP
jgi:hypothetical protein